jgi:transcriptional regulator with XRE-family HTH domain
MFGNVLRQLRTDAGLSLRALGERCHYSHSYLWDLERGHKQPTLAAAQRLDAALSAGGRLAVLVSADNAVRQSSDHVGLEFASDWLGGVDAATGLWRWDVQRRDLIVGAFSAAAFLAPAMRWLTYPLDDAPAASGAVAVEASDVETLRRVTATFRDLDNRHGGGQVYGRVVRFLHGEVTPLLRGRYDRAVGPALFSAAAEMTQLAGWAAYDCGLHGVAQRYLIQALRLAATAGDRPLGAEILAAMSHQCAYLGAGAEAVDLARASGHAAADAGVEAIEAEAAVLEAQGHAVGGDSFACAKALDRAERTLDRADRNAEPQWLGYFSEAYLAAKFAHCFVALGEGRQGVRFATRSLDMDRNGFVRGCAFNLAVLSAAHAQAGEIEAAASTGVQLADAMSGLSSDRARYYLADVANRLAPHAGLPAVDEFSDQARGALTGARGPA